ncbi:MarR family transcriptional regulator [Brevibacillus ginsengisoli]|uniref:MarR family transcriptional regulator n=1 Tax=Brevibacillus ginsengisoli TaxID=363854 RepID=UPI003CF58F4E
MSNSSSSESPMAMKLYRALGKTSAITQQRAESKIRKMGITGARLQVLQELSEAKEPLKPSELGQKLRVTKANITVLLGSLEQDRFIRRVGTTGDGRMNLAQITSEGEAFLKKIVPQHQNTIEELMNGLRQDEQKQLLQLLDKLAGHVEDLS